MGIQDKIDQIRQKPEHIRLRYAWMFTAIAMVFIIAVWFLSLRTKSNQAKGPVLSESQKETLKNLQDQKKSLKDATNQVKSALDQANSLESQPASDNNQNAN